MTPPHVAEADCERCRPGLIAQPVNTISSASFVAVGAALLHTERSRVTPRPSEHLLAWATIAAGMGSIAYHGPGTPAGRYVHDAGLLAMLGALVVSDTDRTGVRLPDHAGLVVLPLAGVLALDPRVSMIAQGVSGVAAIVAETVRQRKLPARVRAARRGQIAVTTFGVAAQLLGRSGGPLCRPDSPVQAHAMWHTAMALTVWFRHVDGLG